MRTIDFSKNKFFYLFADCFVVKGYTRSMICDVSRKKNYFIDNTYYEVLIKLSKHSIGEIIEMLERENDCIELDKFLDYLINNELGTIVDDLAVFPQINMEWDHPSVITNALIDVRNKFPDFQKIFLQLDDLNCYYIQIRFFVCIPLEKLIKILLLTYKKNFRGLQIFFKYEENATIFSALKKITHKFPIASLTIHSTAETYLNKIKNKNGTKGIMLLKQQIKSHESCGIINLKSLHLPSLNGFIENIEYNGCLNRKISIDEHGEIKNCPSMKKSYGNIKDTSLQSVVDNNDFRSLWHIKKDQIEICKDCEYRRLCTDCRAYLQNPSTIYSKPLKCGYDPYTAKWEEWSVNPLNKQAINYYRLE